MHPNDADGMANSVDPDQEQSDLGLHCLLRPVCPNIYRNVPKFSYRLVWANSADPDQTARSSLIRVYTICNFFCIFWIQNSKEKPLVQPLG